MSTVIVTGASSGIGLEMATTLAHQGHEVILVARSTAALEGAASGLERARVVTADLGTPEGVAAVIEAVPSADIVINNAGFGDCGPLAEIDPQVATSMIEVNCVALTALARAYLPGMLERRSGKILNIASTAAFQPGPTMAVYYATKAYVLSFTEAVAEEVRGTGVTVTAFCPGAFESGFQAAAHAGNTRLVKGRKLPSSATTAAQALRAMERGDVVHVPGLTNKVGAFSPRLTPRPVIRRVVHYIQGEV